LAVSHDEQKIALLLGTVLIRDQVEMTEIVVYKNSAPEGSPPRFEIDKLIDWEFNEPACVNF